MDSEHEALSGEVEDACKRLGEEFLRAMTRVCRASRAGVPAFFPLAITTITFVGTFRAGVPVERVREAATSDPRLAASVGLAVDTPEPKRKRRVAPKGPRKSFVNQVSFRLAEAKKSGKSAKLFHNGSIHVTGCASMVDFLEMSHAIALFVHAVTGAELQLATANVQMINAGTVVVDDRRRPLRFAPKDLCHAASALGYNPDFDPERHPGVKVVVKDAAGARVATACVFQTGNVSIIGARSPDRVADAFELVAGMLRACAHVARPGTGACKTTSRKPLSFQQGYPAGTYMSCIS